MKPEDILNALDAADPHTRLADAGADGHLALRSHALLRAAARVRPEPDEALAARVLAGIEQDARDLPAVADGPHSRWSRWGGAWAPLAAAAVLMVFMLVNPAGNVLRFEAPVLTVLTVRGEPAATPVYTESELRDIASGFAERLRKAAGRLPRAVRATVHVGEGAGGALEVACHVEGRPVAEPRVFADPAVFAAALDDYARLVAEALARRDNTP